MKYFIGDGLYKKRKIVRCSTHTGNWGLYEGFCCPGGVCDLCGDDHPAGSCVTASQPDFQVI